MPSGAPQGRRSEAGHLRLRRPTKPLPRLQDAQLEDPNAGPRVAAIARPGVDGPLACFTPTRQGILNSSGPSPVCNPVQRVETTTTRQTWLHQPRILHPEFVAPNGRISAWGVAAVVKCIPECA